MDIAYILQELKPLDYHKETKCLTLVFNKNKIIFLREWEDNKLMWHVFENKQSVDAEVDKQERIIPILKRYLNGYER